MSDSDEPIKSPAAESPVADDDDAIASGDDLFGDGGSDAGSGGGSADDGGDDDDEGQLSDQPLSEHGLDSEDDEERYGGSRYQQVSQTKEEVLMDVNIYRHRAPKAADGALKSLRIPHFIKMNPEEYRPDTFTPSDFDLEDSLAKNPQSVVRFRRDADTGTLQSNAAVYRWSDGSVTLAIGDEHFEVLTKGLAPPTGSDKPYQELQDAHYYAAAAHLSSSLLLTVGHVTDQYSVRPNRTVGDDATQRLAERLQAANKSWGNGGTNMIIRTVRDPELAKKEAELAEKERERARRRRETAAARLDGVPGAGGRGSGGWSGALTVGDLEGGGSGGGRRGGSGRKKSSGGGGGGSRTKRRRDEYDSDDELPRGARRNDEYDKADDFIAPSDDELSDEDAEGDDDEEDDEEEEVVDDDDDDEEDDRRAVARRAKRQKTAEAEDKDAEGDDEDVPASRRNRRHIIDDDDDE